MKKKMALTTFAIFICTFFLFFFNYFKSFDKPIYCSMFVDSTDSPIPCSFSLDKNSNTSKNVIQKESFKQIDDHSFVVFRANTQNNKSYKTRASLGIENTSKVGLVKTTLPNVLASQELHEYASVDPSEVPAIFNSKNELYAYFYTSRENQIPCIKETTDAFYTLMQNPSPVTHIKYLIKARKCPLVISQINYY